MSFSTAGGRRTDSSKAEFAFLPPAAPSAQGDASFADASRGVEEVMCFFASAET